MIASACTWIAAFAPLPQDPATEPLPYAHAHNDYVHARPLLDALEAGCTSVEADIVWLDGELRVAHGPASVKDGVTLESAYLRPLAERVAENRGTVHGDGALEFQLLVDFKTGRVAAYERLHALLDAYSGLVTSFDEQGRDRGAVTVVLTGDYPREHVFAAARRYCAGDGWLDDVAAGRSADEVPLLSRAWRREFSWFGEGEMPDAELARLIELVERAHAAGRKIRFWGVPDLPAIWDVQLLAGVDWLDLDDLGRAARFLRAHWAPPPRIATHELLIAASRRVVEQFEPLEIAYGIHDLTGKGLTIHEGPHGDVLFDVERHAPDGAERWRSIWTNTPTPFGIDYLMQPMNGGPRRVAPGASLWLENTPDPWVSAEPGRYRIRILNDDACSPWIGLLVTPSPRNAAVLAAEDEVEPTLYGHHRVALAGVPPDPALLEAPVSEPLRDFYAVRSARFELLRAAELDGDARRAAVDEVLRLTEAIDLRRYGGATGGTGALALRVRAAALALAGEHDPTIEARLARFPARPEWNLPGERE